MSDPRRIRATFFAVVGVAASVVGCSGGGSSPAPSPTSSNIAVVPTPQQSGATPATSAPSGVPSGPTTTFTPRTSATGTTLSTYTLQSNPSGLAITINGLPAGTTPSTFKPGFATGLTAFTIASSNGGSAFAYQTDQTANGNHTIYYNQQFDINGAIASIATSAVARDADATARNDAAHNAAARTDAAGEPHTLVPLTRHAPAFSRSRLEVRYRNAMLAAGGRTPLDVERAEGIVRAVDVGPSSATERTRIVDVPPTISIDELRARLAARSEVEWVAPVQLRYKASATPMRPNDTHFDSYQQWDMFRVQSVPSSGQFDTFAWGYTTGAPRVTIAIIDTGIDAHHQDLSGGKVTYGEKIVHGTITAGIAAAQDTDGHGTDVAGIAAADTNNGFGFAGTGYNTSLQIYKVFPDESNPAAETGDEAQAMYDAVAHGANIISISITGTQDVGFDPVERDAVAYAIAHGVTIVAAAGNERSSGATTIDFPAAYPGVISVGSTALNDSAQPNLAAPAMEYVPGYSNFGPELSLVAPGGDPQSLSDPDLLHWIYNIYTTTPLDPTLACKNINDCKGLFAGTSQAAPHVAGAAALLLSVNPALTPSQIAQILESSADDIHDPFQGHGRLDVYRALAAVKSDTTGLPRPTSFNFRAFAYTVTPGSSAPTIIDLTYTNGVPVSSSGTYRVADVPASATNFKIGVWDDVNGDGIVDAGDYFGSSSTCATALAPCAGATSITVHPVTASFGLQ